jgi:hypothetical protein
MAKKRILASEAARALGSITTPRKAASSARNGAVTQFKPKPLESFACTCGKCPDDPKTYCPRGRAIRRRQAAQAATPAQTGRPTLKDGDTGQRPIAAFLARAAALDAQLAATGFIGINGADMVNAGRDERAARIIGDERDSDGAQ